MYYLQVFVLGRVKRSISGRETGNIMIINISESEVSYRKAIDKNKMSADAGFNLGDALYKQNKYEDAGKQFLENSNVQMQITGKNQTVSTILEIHC